MVELNAKWKLDPSKAKVEILSPIASEDVEKAIARLPDIANLFEVEH